jgi:hypothetical protein
MVPVTNTAADGSHTHLTSLSRTRIPHSEKKPKPKGETSIGLQGKKNLSLLNGANNAIPSPPLVSMSSNGCDSVDKNKKMNVNEWPLSLSRNKVKASNALNAAAKKIEWVKPRCPSISPYLILKLKPITSRSGMTEHAAPAKSSVGDTVPSGRQTDRAIGMAG